MNRKRIAIIILAPIGIALFILIGGELVMHLWNWLAPTDGRSDSSRWTHR